MLQRQVELLKNEQHLVGLRITRCCQTEHEWRENFTVTTNAALQ
jgi:hypothetical protein